MKNTSLFEKAQNWLSCGQRLAIATVTSTWKSAPRPKGAHVIVREDGLFEGSVSGGCVEGEVIVRAQEMIAKKAPATLLSFGIEDKHAWTVGLPCGGSIQIFIQTVSESQFPPDLVATLLHAHLHRKTCILSTDMRTGKTVRVHDAHPQPRPETLFHNMYLPSPRLAIVGAVHIAQTLVNLAHSLGYDVHVIDPRSAFARKERFPQIALSVQWPDDFFNHNPIDAFSAVVTLTHDSKLDDPALVAALHSPAFYIGALGSRKTHEERCARLIKSGFSQDQILRIQGPVGLDIHAKTPAEIAVAIGGQMIAFHRKSAPEKP